MIVPLEVSYTWSGRKRRKERNVIGVICPTPIALRMRLAKPIYVSMGDVKVDWKQTSSGFETMNDLGFFSM